MYANDLKITIALKSLDTVKLQSAIRELEKWCNNNDLHLNLDKFSILSISRKRDSNVIKRDYFYGDHKLNRVTEQKYLGVIIDSKLSFDNHKTLMVSGVASTLGFIKCL